MEKYGGVIEVKKLKRVIFLTELVEMGHFVFLMFS